MAKWRDLRPGDVIRVKGVKYSIEGVSGTEYALLDESGVSRTGHPRDLDAEVEMILRADDAVSALSALTKATPMECAAAAVRVVLGGVVVGEQGPGGSWLCPGEATSDAVTLRVHQLMFHNSYQEHTHRK